MLDIRHSPILLEVSAVCQYRNTTVLGEPSTQLHTASKPFLHRIFYPSISSSHTSTASLCPALRISYGPTLFECLQFSSCSHWCVPNSSSNSLTVFQIPCRCTSSPPVFRSPHVFATSLPPLVPIAMERSPDILTPIGSSRTLHRSTTLSVVSKR